jgi:hypothetical protein
MATPLARPGIDLGLPTHRRVEMCEFYEREVGLVHLETAPIVEGQDEIFYTMHGSWLKLNATDWELPPAVTGYRELLIADAGRSEPRHLTDPDGLAVTLVPVGHRGIDEVGVVVAANDLEEERRFVVEGMGGVAVGGDAGANAYRVGNTVLFLEQAPEPIAPTPILTQGFTMLTLIVDDLLTAHQAMVAAGGIHGLRPAADPAEPERCVYSFVADPTGNWIELVQFGELSGPLPDLSASGPSFDEFFAFRDHATPA